MFTNNHIEEILGILIANRQCNEFELEQYREVLGENTVFSFESIEEILDDFDLWQEQSDIITEKIMDANFWSSL